MFLIKWDQIKGGVVWLKYPEDLAISDNVVQQIEISHNFIESYISIKALGWNSISYCNEKKEITIVLVLSDYDDSSDYLICVEEFNKSLDDKILNKAQLLEKMKDALNMKVFRTTEEVISKISNEWSTTKMKLFELEGKIEDILKTEVLSVKGRILMALLVNSSLKLGEIKRIAKTSTKWTQTVLEDLIKNRLVSFSKGDKTYSLSI
ncbi:MAG: hypothetical protein JW891_14810 [Candidatus Lokiarchaeota archaeon]|nr:hypothetical protein [Candidatus Lokiarchaeota archaeon]